MKREAKLWSWVLGEFATPQALVVAAHGVREKGHRDLDAYTPFPIHGIDRVLGFPRSRVPLIALVGALSGVALAYWFQWWMNAYDWPINVGNRPPHSPPSFIPITFELGVLLSALAIFFGLMGLSRLPQPYHPVFEVEAFRSASTHGYWLSVRLEPGGEGEVEEQLRAAGAQNVQHVLEEPDR